MYLSGRYPGKKFDRVLAIKQFSQAAIRGQQDSGIMVAMYNMRGHPDIRRSAQNAVEWARFVSEQSPALGKVLAKALKAYRTGTWSLAVLYYMLAAETGFEIGHFNLAYLCEQNPDGVTAVIEKDCIWRHYNLSVQRELKFVNTFAQIKMGDYYWYGHQGHRDPVEAARLYARAAQGGDPHAMFNLAVLVEEGVNLPAHLWKALGIASPVQSSNTTVLHMLYDRCMESSIAEAFLPCSLALLRLHLLDLWQDIYQIIFKLCSLMGSVVLTVVILVSLISCVIRQEPTVLIN